MLRCRRIVHVSKDIHTARDTDLDLDLGLDLNVNLQAPYIVERVDQELLNF